MRPIPISENSRKIFEKKNHACLGISPFNSCFSEERIGTLAEWAMKEFETFHLFVPDIPSAFTLEALGYSQEKPHGRRADSVSTSIIKFTAH